MAKISESNLKTLEKRLFLKALIWPVLVLLVLQWSGLLDSVEYRLQDYHYQRGGLVSPDIYVIGIDEETMLEYGSWQNWSRRGTAELLRVLNQDPELAPAVIGLDIGFFGESSPQEDAALAQAAALVDNVVTTSYASFGRTVSEDGTGAFHTEEGVVTYETPYEELKEHVAYGFSNVPVDGDGIVRHSLYRIQAGEETAYSFAAELYRAYMGELPDCIEEGKRSGYITFSGLPYEFYGSETAGLSFSKVVSGEIPAELFAGSIVLVGPYTSGMMDAYYTAVSRDVPMYGVEVHANILQAFLDGLMKRELGGAPELAVTAAVFGAVILCLSFGSAGRFLPATAAVLVLYWLAAGAAFERGWILPLLFPLAGSAVLVVCQVGLRYAQERRAKKRLEGIFGKYVSREVASSIVKGGEEALRLGGQKKDIAVLFVDIRGFTPLSEALPPEKVVEILNHYLEVTTSAVFANQGTVDKFIGDATMAVFNAPLDLEDYVFKAVKTGLDMAAAAKGLEEELALVTDKKVGFGVGINCGEAIVGNIGTSLRMDYTAIGNTVNVAARLEGQAKAGEVVISQAVYERLKGRIEAVSIGKRPLKGIAGEAELYRVVGVAGQEGGVHGA